EDDAARLVYADWLEERGAPGDAARAEFIRVQFALAGLPADDPRRLQLEERERDLRLAHEAEWLAPLREVGGSGWQFRRGFPEQVTLTPEQFRAGAGRLFRLAPVRAVKFIGPNELWDLVGSPLLGRLDHLTLNGNIIREGAAHVLAGAPFLGRLTGL